MNLVLRFLYLTYKYYQKMYQLSIMLLADWVTNSINVFPISRNTSSPEVADNSRLKSKDPDNKPSCSKRKFSPDTEDKSDTSDASDCESDSNESDTQKNTSTSQTPPPKSKNRRGSKRRRDNDGEPHFKTFILSPCSESNSGPSHSSVNLDWLRLRQDLVPMNGHLQDVPKVAIRKLSLRGYPGVSDHSLHFLSDLKLDLLDVTGTKVTKNGLTHFLLTNPQCRVLHQSACTCPIDVGF